MAHKRTNRFASQAALEALLRFGPELSGLKELRRQAEENYKSGVLTARGTSRGIVQAVDQARPDVKKIYDRAGLDQARSAHMLTGDIAELPGVANSIKAGAQLEATNAVGGLRDAQSAALTDLSQRRVAAKEGEQFAVQNAGRTLVDELTKVLTRKQDLARERGAFTALTTRQLRTEATNEADKLSIAAGTRNQSERNSIRSSGVDPDTGKPIKGGPADKTKITWDTPAAQREARTTISTATNAAKNLLGRNPKIPRKDLEKALQNGQKPQPLYETVKDPRTGKTTQRRVLKDDGTQATTDAIPQVTDNVLLGVALDLAYGGFISRKNVRLLHANGIKVKPLGARGPKSTAPQKRRAAKRNKAAGGKLYGPAF